MTKLWQWLGFAVAVIAAILGASWAKKQLEARGAKKQRDLQQNEADRVEGELHENDKAIDAEIDETIAQIKARQAARHELAKLGLRRTPTPEEIEAYIRESKE